MAFGIGPAFKLRYDCEVCGRETLPALNNRDLGNPDDPDRYKWCSLCHHEVPYSMRRKKTYQRRWDEYNARELYKMYKFLWSELHRRDPQEYPAETEAP